MGTPAAFHSVRAGATPIAIENTGDVVYLYDEARADDIRAAHPAWAAGDVGYDPAAPAFVALAAAGDMLAYEPAAHAPLRAELVVGAPLTPAELASAAWLRPAAGRLSLPSGKLAVESVDALRLTAEPPTDSGAVVAVPAGDYVLTLHRLDRAAMGDAGAAWPDEVLVLTPAAEAEAPADGGPYLRYPVARPRWGAWKVEAGPPIPGSAGPHLSGLGEVTWALVGAGTNLDAGAVSRLGLRPGMRLEAKLGPQTHFAVFLGNLDLQAYRELVGSRDLDAAAKREPDLARAYMYPNPGPEGEVIPALAFHDFTGAARAWSALEIGMPVEVRMLPDPVFAAPDDGWSQMWQVADGALRTEVVGCGAEDLVLGATPDALAALGAVAGDRLALEVAGATRALWLAADERAAMQLRARPPAAASAGALVAWPMPHWELGDRRVLRSRLLAAGGEAAHGLAAEPGTPATLRK